MAKYEIEPGASPEFSKAAFEAIAGEIFADMRRRRISIRRISHDGLRFSNERIDPKDWYLYPEDEQ
jgi:hypothetical protein